MKHEPVTSKPSSETQGQLVGATGFLRAKVFAPTSCPWVSEDASKLEKAKASNNLSSYIGEFLQIPRAKNRLKGKWSLLFL